MSTATKEDASEGAATQRDEHLELTVLMPCLNEAETLAACIEKARQYLQRSGVKGEVLIADNGSNDGSQEIARINGARVINVSQRGYGAALNAGIAEAHGTYTIMGDADDSYDFSSLDAFLQRLRAGDDLVIGNRFRGGIAPGAMPPLHRYIGNPALSFIGRFFFGIPVADFHCGLRGFNTAAIRELGLNTTGMEFASEMVVRSSLKGLRISEVPTTLKLDGRSRAPHLKTWRDGWRHLKFLLLFSPRWLFFVPGASLFVLGGFLASYLALGAVPLPGGFVLDLNTFTAACFMMICGVQLFSFGVFARSYTAITGMLPRTKNSDWMQRVFTTDNVIRVAFATLVIGAGIFAWALAEWAKTGFGDLETTHASRAVIGGLSLVVIAIQSAFHAFLIGLLEIPIARRDKP